MQSNWRQRQMVAGSGRVYRNSVNGQPISVTPPNFVELEIVDTIRA